MHHQCLDLLILVTWSETTERESRDGSPCWRWLWDSGSSSRCRGYSCCRSTPRTCGKTERRPRTWQSARLSGTDWLQTFLTRCGELSHSACCCSACLHSNPVQNIILQNSIRTGTHFSKVKCTNHVWYIFTQLFEILFIKRIWPSDFWGLGTGMNIALVVEIN